VITSLLEWRGDSSQSSLGRSFTIWFRRVFFPAKYGKEDNVPAVEDLEEVRTMLAETEKNGLLSGKQKENVKER
jgi:hypothetical protein